MTTAIPTSMRPIDWKKRKIVEIEVQCADSSGDCIFPLSANDADSGGNTQALCNSVDLTEESSLDQALTPKLIERGPSAILYPKKSIWYDASVNDARSFRKTLSTPDVDVTADTGVLYMRVRGLVEFSLPIPQEKTMVSIRIDTGMEKLDTDYVYLNDIEALFQQEFCIPVRPGLEISLTLHLMQAPHLQPRYMPPIPTHYITPDAYDYACTLEDYLEERIHPSIPRCKGYGLALGCSPQKNQGGLLSNEKWMGDTLPHCNFRNHPLEMTTAWNLDVDPWTNLSPDTITSRCDNSKNNEGFLTTASPMQGVSKEKPTHRHRDLAGVFRSWRDSILNTVSKRHKSETTSGTSRSKDRMPKGCSMDLTDREQLFQEAFWPIEHSLWMEDYSKRMDGSIGKSSTVSQSSTLVQSSPLSTSSSIPQTSSPSLTRSSTVVSDHEDIGCHADGSTGLQEASSEDEGRGADEYGEHPLSLLSGIKFLPQLSETEIKREETPVQVLTRFIDFKDELCIGRSGIVFKDIQGSCSNQIVNVEFLTVNTWMDKNDYSRLVFSGVGSNNGLYTPEYHLDSAVTKLADPCSRPNTMREQTSGQSNEEDMSIEKSEIKYKEDVSTESDGCADKEEEGWKSQTVAKVLTTLCFIPGPQMDPEDAIYEDPESYPVTEPQSLAECQLGLIYFNWQNHVFYEGQLFYLTEQQTWQEGFFQLKGSRLWQVDEYDTEKRIRWMDLSTIRQIVTSMGCFKATAQYLDEDDGGGEDNERRTSSPSSLLMDESGRVLLSESLRVDPEETGEEDGSLCPIENGFRLLLMSPSLETEQDVGKSRSTMGRDGSDVKEGDGPGGDKMLQRNQSKLGGCVMQQQHQSRMVAQGFYAGSPDEAQAWVVALMCSCRDRPPPPHWLDGDS
ncbi:hypothetical protein BGW38_009197 [Lunasporangiospora selenospora]|uniref:PH domain-containing protein n=1 Tax=Lunasporangiospora selenospora TaxID=979761 RepID=A0A9P6FXI3_9FUNG|nr:hypothetical protein BGW38_009197 [Lunasporangiospora selenospora]